MRLATCTNSALTRYIHKHPIALLSLFLCLLLTACNDNSSNSHIQGYIEGDYTYISSPFAGKLTQLSVKRGEMVKKGQMLFQLDKEPQKAKLQAQTAFVQAARASLANLKKTKRQPIIDELDAKKMQAVAELKFLTARYQRNLTLFKRKVVDADSLEASKTKLATTKALIEQIEAQIDNAKLASRVDVINAQEKLVQAKQAQLFEANWSLVQKKAVAPYAARVVDTFYREGEFVNASLSVLSLLAEKNKQVIFFIPGSQLSLIKLNQHIKVSAGAHAMQQATISYIADMAEYTPPVVFSRKNNPKLVYKVRARPSQPSKLHPGQPVEIQLGQAHA